MLIGTVEHNAKAALLSLVEEINNQHSAAWGLVAIRRFYLKKMSNDEIILAIKPALQEVAKQKIFFIGEETIYVTWFGMPRQTYQKISAICQLLTKPGIIEPLTPIVRYLDPLAMGDELSVLLKDRKTKTDNEHNVPLSDLAREIWHEEHDFTMTAKQIDQHKKILSMKALRSRLNILIVEDQYFLRSLLSEVLNTGFDVDGVEDIKEGWNFYLQKAPDIVFLDIQLPDGSGHALAKKIKELDPSSYIVMVTASNQLNDVEMAKQNHVDGFIVKPFNKKRISDCIDHYLATHNHSSKKKNLI